MIANLERNELKNRTFELEEQLVAKKTALKDISKENAELKAKIADIEEASQGGHASVMHELNQKMDYFEKAINEKESAVNELKKENSYLRRRINEYQDQPESSEIEELNEKFKTKQAEFNELCKQNVGLSKEIYSLRMQLNESEKGDAVMQQLSMENENKKTIIKSLENGLNQSKMQLLEFQKTLHIKDQEVSQLVQLKEYCESLQQNIMQLNEKLVQKDEEVQMIGYERDQKILQASQEISRLQQMINGSEHQNSLSNTQKIEEYESKISEVMTQLVERDTALETMMGQFQQMVNQQKQGEDEVP